MGPMVAPRALLRQHPETQDEPDEIAQLCDHWVWLRGNAAYRAPGVNAGSCLMIHLTTRKASERDAFG